MGESPERFTATDYLTGDAFELRRTAAGWWAVSTPPADLSRYYPSVYYGERKRRRFPALVEGLQRLLYAGRARSVTQARGRVGRVLDVGCGPGHQLKAFRELGWECEGTEFSEGAAASPREHYGLNVHTGDLCALQLPAASFDAVVSWHTLEHMAAPAEVLDEIVRVLAPEGILLLSVPDFSSPEAQADPVAWFHLDVPRHLCQFPAAVLRVHCERRGLKIIGVSHSALEYDTFSLVQTWQNRAGLRHNLLYLTLKSSRHVAGARGGILPCAAAVAMAAIMLPIAFVVSIWRAWRKRGAVVIFMARKTR